MPPPVRLGAGWFLASASVNLALLVALVWIGYQQREAERLALAPFTPLDPGTREVAMIFLPPQAGGGDGDAAIAETRNALELSRALAPIAAAPVEFVSPPLKVPDRVTPVSRDSSALATAIGTHRRLGPAFTDGRVWKTPPLTDQERIEIAVRVAQLDPAVRERLANLLAEIPPDSFAFAVQQEWTKEIGGRKWGIDQQWIHLGGIKNPQGGAGGDHHRVLARPVLQPAFEVFAVLELDQVPCPLRLAPWRRAAGADAGHFAMGGGRGQAVWRVWGVPASGPAGRTPASFGGSH